MPPLTLTTFLSRDSKVTWNIHHTRTHIYVYIIKYTAPIKVNNYDIAHSEIHYIVYVSDMWKRSVIGVWPIREIAARYIARERYSSWTKSENQSTCWGEGGERKIDILDGRSDITFVPVFPPRPFRYNSGQLRYLIYRAISRAHRARAKSSFKPSVILRAIGRSRARMWPENLDDIPNRIPSRKNGINDAPHILHACKSRERKIDRRKKKRNQNVVHWTKVISFSREKIRYVGTCKKLHIDFYAVPPSVHELRTRACARTHNTHTRANALAHIHTHARQGNQ